MAQQPADPIIGEFLADVDWTPENKQNAVSILNRFHRFLTDHATTIAVADRAHIRSFLEHRKAAGLAPATRQIDWRMLRAFYRWAATAVRDGGGGERDDNPMDAVKAPKVPTRPTTRAAKPGDVETLEQTFPTRTLTGRRNAAMVSLMFRSGLRVGELPPLNLADLTERPDGNLVLALWDTKTDEPRRVPVHPQTQRYLNRYLRSRGPLPGPLFLGDPGRTHDPDGRLRTRAIQMMMTRACERAGIRIAPHQLRRGFTAQYLRQGGDVLSLEIIGGWADHRMPRRYLADEETDAALDRYFALNATPPPPRRRGLRAVD